MAHMQWEYMTILCDASKGWFGGKFDAQELTNRLNELGREQWELVAMLDTAMWEGRSRDIVAVLKRERRG